MDYSLGEHYRLESSKGDKLNLRLMRWDTIAERDGPRGKVTGTREGWAFTGKYAPNVADGLRLAFEDAQVNNPGETKSLKDTLAAVRHIADELKQVSIDG